MTPFNLTDLIVVLFLSLVAGYFLLSVLVPERIWKNLRKRRYPVSRSDPESRPSPPRRSEPNASQRTRTIRATDPGGPRTEREHAEILGLHGKVTVHQIKTAYRNEIAKYHPDKVTHLAPEFQELARERTRLIRAAYDYFRKNYPL